MKLSELARLVDGKVIGDTEEEITGVSNLDEAVKGDISLFKDRQYLNALYSSKASAFIVKEEIKDLTANFIKVDNPNLAFAKALEIFYKRQYI